MEAYNKLLEKHRELAILSSIGALMSWDTFTSLPPGAVSQRAEQGATFQRLLHRMEIEEEVNQLLKRIESDSAYNTLDEVQKRNVYLKRRDFDISTCLPEEFIGRWMKQRTITNSAREKALAKSDWSIFEPEFKKMYSIIIEASEYLMDVVGVSTHYDVPIDGFQTGMRADIYSEIFDKMKKSIPQLIRKYSEASKNVNTDFLKRKVEKFTQIRIMDALAEFVRYDLHSENAVGKLGESVHPLSIGSYEDVRISLDYKENDFFDSCVAFLHESGHALYEMNLNRDWMYQPVGSSGGFGVHESQSRFLENMVGRSPEFIDYFLPILNEVTSNQFADIAAKDFTMAINQVKPGPIRVTSDELTYTQHIIIRFEIERDLFDDKLEISDIPSIWNELYEKYLGVSVENDAEGALQDLHWGVGQFGHFPTYALGNIFAAQLAETMQNEIPDWKEKIRIGEIERIIDWMTENIHRKGNLYDAPVLISHITGKKMSSQPYVKYLEKKFSDIYD